MSPKTEAERDLIDTQIKLKATKSRMHKVELVLQFNRKHGQLPVSLLDVFGHSEYVRGFGAGVKDATGEDDD
ncbi:MULTISPECIES: hypothetical protein [unclassified Microbacterium]|uniref:hypothetical protein n=1 Tax=unclassified Microbacterium TaxID=2609290 RepID=UPI000EAAC72D|nr:MULTISPECIES: hypothetical protein [unclassified Microbacterium]MBT2484808.1 hypothetical protein [Microbacterium sp. ISL-108]RKN67681.1 hypothetical protein D7252_08840 [Microbacterium sp. CGR2]